MYVLVALPGVPTALTYSADLSVAAGDAVLVPFRTRQARGVVLQTGLTAPTYPTKQITDVIQAQRLTPPQLAVLLFLQSYYGAHMGQALRLFVPDAVAALPLPHAVLPPPLLPFAGKQLTPEQQQALALFAADTRPLLLHGITGSGKTEVYAHLIRSVLAEGKQALVLVPEIALTAQMMRYLSPLVGAGQIACVHSDLGQKTRREQYAHIASGRVRIVVGSRSALFAPLRTLGLIVIDEEHEWTYKSEHDPRYHARTLAQVMCLAAGARLVLGSATPSIESYAAAQEGRIAYAALRQRAGEGMLPTVHLIDMRHAVHASKKAKITTDVAEAIRERLRKKEQIIMLHNRRGFASAVTCATCGTTATCPDCGIALAYHLKKKILLCHSCGRIAQVPSVCPSCGGHELTHKGIGTEKVVSELAALFPSARIVRLDRDAVTASTPAAHILKEFEQADILVGTQMVAKGLHFPRVTLSVVLLAESGMNIPDFRAGEKTFALCMQLAGRSGRGSASGEVYIQTYDPSSALLQAVRQHDYGAFFDAEYARRKEFGYPPYARMARIEVIAASPEEAEATASMCAEQLRIQQPEATVTVFPALQEKRRGKHVHLVQIVGVDPRWLATFSLPRGAKLDIDPMQMV